MLCAPVRLLGAAAGWTGTEPVYITGLLLGMNVGALGCAAVARARLLC